MNDARNEFNFFFEDELEDIQPLYPEIEAAESQEAAPRKKNYITTFDPKERYTPAERINRLMASTKSTSKVLESVIGFCLDMKPISEVNEYITQQQLNNASVYGPETLCHMLEEAGALARVYEDGTCAADETNEPTVVVIDGVEYLEAPASRPSFWLATEDGRAYLASLDHDADLRKLLESQPEYFDIYQLVLSTCAAEGGASAQDLAGLINGDPRVQNPRRYSGYFVDQLQERAALAWTGAAWSTTPLGLSALR